MNLRKQFLGLLGLGSFFAHSLFGQTGNDNPGGVTAEYYGSSEVAGHYDPYTGNGKREIDDIVVAGSVGQYPLKFTRTLSTRGAFDHYLGAGSGWSHSFIWDFSIRPADPNAGEDHQGVYDGPLGYVTYPEGGRFDLWDEGPVWNVDANGPHNLPDVMVDCTQVGGCTSGAAFELRRIDGGKVLFDAPPPVDPLIGVVGRVGRASQIIDPYGQSTTLTYNPAGMLWKVTEPGGRYLEFFYQRFSWTTQTNPPMQAYEDVAWKITANDGRGNITETVTYEYEPVWIENGGVGRQMYNLRTVNYDDGSHASYLYVPANTDWSGNGIAHQSAQVVHTCDDPRYAGPMKQVEYEYVPRTETPDAGRGQLKSEKNLYGQMVARSSYPTYPVTAADLLKRTETRGDGPSRSFNYLSAGDAYESSRTWTDFKNQTWTETTCYTTSLYGWKITDPRQNTTIYERDSVSGVLRKITYPQTDPTRPAATIELTYSDAANPYYLSGKKDENDHWTFYDRDPATHQVMQVRYPDGGAEQFTYNGFGEVLTHTLRSGGVENFRYDSRGLKTLSWSPPTESDPNPEQHPTVYAYYQPEDGDPGWIDRLKSVTDPRGNATWFEYNQRGQVTKLTHQDATFTQNDYNADGTLAWTADENHPNASWNVAERTRFEYDEYKRVRKVINPMGEITDNWYGLNPVTWGDPLVHTTNCVKYTLSPMGKNVVYGYDENFRKSYQVQALSSADEAWTWFDYDEVGNLNWTRDPRWNVTTFGYDARNRKIWMNDPLPADRNTSHGHTTDWEYDGVGNKLKETRADDAFRSWEYDIPNRITRAIDWRISSSELAITTIHSYDAQGLTESVTDAKGAVYTFTFDVLHRKKSETYPPDVYGASRSETFKYDVSGNLILYKNPANQYKHLDWYDARNRLRHLAWNVSASDNAPDRNVGPETSTAYDDASRVTSISTNGGETAVAFGYDDANRQVWEDQALAGYSTRRVSTPRDADGNRQSINTSGINYFVYQYDQRNQLSHLVEGNGNPFYDFSYDAAGNEIQRQSRVWYTSVTNFEYDSLNRATTVENGTVNWIFGRSHYQYDKAGREITTWRDDDHGVGGSRGERFEYESTNQIKKASYNAENVWTGTAQNAVKTQDYIYTPERLNRASLTENGVTTSYAPNALNQYQSNTGVVYNYDDRFNLREAPNFWGVYDAESRLTMAGGGGNVISFTYDGLGRCVRRIVYPPGGGSSAVIYYYDGWNPVLEFDAAGNYRASNIYGARPDEILVRWDTVSGGAVYKPDAHGNVMTVLDMWGTIAERYSYDVFGRVKITGWWDNDVRASSALGNRFLFQGREWIAELGIYDYRHRMYNPELGRFLQTDPMGLQTEGEKLSAGQKALYGAGAPEAFSSSEMNLFRYCGDDPVDKSDPTGLKVRVEGDEDFKRHTEQHLGDNRAMDPAYEKAYQKMDQSDEEHVIKPASDSGNKGKVLSDGSKGNHNAERYKSFWSYIKSFFTNRTGSTTYYDPNNWRTDYGGFRDPHIGLGHEFFGHGLSRNDGNEFQDDTVGNEARAIRSENIARRYIDGSRRSEDYYDPVITYPYR